MSVLNVHWYRVFGLYFAVAFVMFAAAIVVEAPVRGIFLFGGVMLVAGFVPLIMTIYFMRGVFATGDCGR
jgi:hypothetical protein